MLLGTLILLGILFTIVIIHETGHLIMAKKYGVKVSTFSIGFGPRLIGFKFFRGKIAYKILNFKSYNCGIWFWGETEYRLACIPFGGFCAMEGEIKGNSKKALIEKPFYQKLLIILGGILFNFITGFIAIAGLVISKLGFLKGLIATISIIKEMVIQACLQTIALITGTVPLAKWEEISNTSANMLSMEGIILQFGFYSIILGLFNALPFPALDGSYPLLWSLEYIFGKEKGRAIATTLVNIGFAILIILQLAIVYYWFFM